MTARWPRETCCAVPPPPHIHLRIEKRPGNADLSASCFFHARSRRLQVIIVDQRSRVSSSQHRVLEKLPPGNVSKRLGLGRFQRPTIVIRNQNLWPEIVRAHGASSQKGIRRSPQRGRASTKKKIPIYHQGLRKARSLRV